MVPLPRPRILAGRVATLAIAVAACAAPPPPDAASAPDLPLAHLNDLRRPAGRMAGDTLVLELDLVRAAWTPRGGTGPRVAVPVFAEAGGAPSVPGPLLRVSAGTPVRLTVRNTLEVEAEIRVPAIEGLGRDSLVLAPGATRSLAWTPATAVSSAYGARVDGERGPNGPTMGVLVVDPPGTLPHPGERILLLTSWGSPAEPGSLSPESSWKMTVNGRSWPFTERFTFAVGDTVRWRVINTSFTRHPMHLHGFYFDVTSAGDLEADTAYAPGSRSPVVTHTMLNLSAMTLSWVPTTPGNWLFHCHLLRHMGANQRFAAESAHAHAGSDAVMAMDDGMAGLITGITVEPAAGVEPAEPPPARRIDLWTGATPGGWGDAPRLALVRQDGAEPPAPDSTVAPSSLLVLRRDEPVEIVVHNRLETPLAVHWHGLELRSVYDGVGHWSGMPGMARPPIPAGDSVRVHLQPPRAGTFMYHTHGEEGHQLAQGLYGALLVLPPGAAHDPDRDRVFVLGAGGAERDAEPAVNGVREPAPERFEAGVTYRLRFAQIAADESKEVRLLRDGEPVRWRPVAKDGADLPASLRAEVPARLHAEVGETFDVEWTPEAAGVHQLVVTTIAYPLDADEGATQTIALAVGEVEEDAVLAAHGGYDGVLSVSQVTRLLDVALVVVPLALLAGLFWLGRTLVRWWRRRRAAAPAVR